jgi:hypothetical protein
METLFEIIRAIFENMANDRSLNTAKIDKNIEELRKYKWFTDLYENEKYHRLFLVNRDIRKYLNSSLRIKRLKTNPNVQRKFVRWLERQLERAKSN